MTENKELDLLNDIVKLTKKYDVQTFERLAAQMSDPVFISRLSQITTAAAKIGRTISSKKHTKRESKLDLRSTLVKLAESDKEKSVLLHFYEDLMSKKLLPTLRDIKTFAEDNGFPIIKAKSREKAVVSLVKYLSSLSNKQVEGYISKVQPTTNINDRSLEGWSNIILTPRKSLE